MNNLALLLLRIVFCGAMIYGHGLGKLNKVIGGNLKFSDPIGIGEVPTLYLAVFSEIIAPGESAIYNFDTLLDLWTRGYEFMCIQQTYKVTHINLRVLKIRILYI